MNLKHVIKRLLYSYCCDGESYIKHLREGGAKIGERVNIYDPRNTYIDVTRPYMIEIGDDVQITRGVTILTHGYDWSVLKGKWNEVTGSCGEVKIGNNCFIGMQATILKGVHIGNDCIIGANSLVNRDIPDGWVAAGNPAKLIMRVEEYRQKRREAQLHEAEELYRCYTKRTGKIPPMAEFDEFFWLFQKRDRNALTQGQIAKMKCVGKYEEAIAQYLSTEPMFDGYDAFLEYMRQKYSEK